MEFLNLFWNIAAELNPKVSDLHEGQRFPDTNADALRDLYARVGFVGTTTAPIEIETHFRDFDDYWKPFLGGQGPAPTYVASLSELERSKLRDALIERLPIQSDGSILMYSRSWAVSCQM
jgi:hypothetical protein